MLGGIYVSKDIYLGASATFTKLPNPPRTEGHPSSITVLKDGKVVCTFSARYGTNFTASSGVFIYDPVAGTWTDKSDANMQYWTKDLVIDPADATQNTWYVGVFSGWGGSANGKGGLYKTTNRGITWVKLSGSLLDRVTSITFNPEDYTQAFVSTETQGLYLMYNINKATPFFQLVNTYIFRQPERMFFNPYKIGELWVTSFGNSLKVGHVKKGQGSGLQTISKNEIVTVFPNPSNGVLNIQGEQSITNVELMNALGQTIELLFVKINDAFCQVDVAQLPKGIYILKVNQVCNKIIIGD